MITSEIRPAAANAAVTTDRNSTPVDHGFSFHELLSALNPLQYMPVVGTLYRAMTGDVIPEALQRAGSLVVSGLLGGPIGVALNVI